MVDAIDVPSLANFNNYTIGSYTATTSWMLFEQAISATSTGSKAFCLGADITEAANVRTANLSMAEFIITPSQLSTVDRQRVQGYLAWKWGLVSNLPAGHPYKTAAP